MRWRTSFACALVGSAGLAFLLVLACQPAFAPYAATGMSAPPPVPAASIEAGCAAQLLQPQFDWYGHVLRVLTFSPTLVAVGKIHGERQRTGDAPPHYGPLHRRPPPSFS